MLTTCIIKSIIFLYFFYSPKEIEDEEYNEFFKAFSKEDKEPLSRSHFTAEGEVTFRSILFVPQKAPPQMFSDYGKKFDHIKVCFVCVRGRLGKFNNWYWLFQREFCHDLNKFRGGEVLKFSFDGGVPPWN